MLRAEIDQLLICDPDQSRSISHVFIGRPSPLEEKSLGKIFAIAAIGSSEPMNTTILQALQETLLERYYHTDDFSPEVAFEHALQAANERLSSFIREGITDWLEHVDILVGVIRGDLLLFTRVGTILAYLIHRGRIVDVIGQTSPAEERVSPLRLFSHVISGRVQADDHVLFCTASLLDYLSVEKIRRIMTTSFPRDTVMQLQSLLHEDVGRTAFAALILKMTTLETAAPAQLAVGLRTSSFAPQSSMQELIKKEQATAELLEPSIWLNVQRALSSLLRGLHNLVRTTILRKPPLRARPLPAYRLYSRERRRSSTGRPLRILRAILLRLWSSVVTGGKAAHHAFDRRREMVAQARRAPDRAEQEVRGFAQRFTALTRNQKIVLLAAVVFLFFLSWSIVSRGRNAVTSTKGQEQQALVSDIEAQTHEAEAFLSFGNDAGATSLIREVELLIGQLPKRSKSDRQRVTDLTARIESVKELARHRTILENLTEKAQFLLPHDAAVRGVVFQGGNLVGFTQNGDVAILNLEEETTEVVPQTIADVHDVQLGIAPTTSTLLLSDGAKGLIEYTFATKQFRQLSTTFANVDREFRSLASFESRIYFLDAKNDQIFRHVRGTLSYGPATAWLRESGVDLENAADLIVDGSVFLLRRDGTIREYFQGRPTTFALQAIDPELKSANRIWTSPTSSVLYLLDPESKRLIAFDKKGNLFDQYQSDAFAGATTFAVDEKNKRAYIVVGVKVFEIGLNR